ncbi:MAG: alpha/beta hydrolase [Rhodobacterales bacterium]|nr:MAG: alpha/beta hydrolase [Rhodobacterales bacterium]
MTQPNFRFAHVLDHEVHVTEWGDPANPAIVCWHGLVRTGRDFDELAAALSEKYFVLCPDTIGRGLSSWSSDPEAEYTLEYYAGIATDLMDYYGLERVGWIGTSMGAMIGMRLASGPHADRLDWLIINDIGPEVPDAALRRIVAYASEGPVFQSVTEAEKWFRAAYVPFGENSDAFWTRMTRTSLRRRGDGLFTTHYDPALIAALPMPLAIGAGPWERWEKIDLPVHLIYGADSDLISAEVVARMAGSGPKPGVTCVAATGHAPTLSQPEQIARVKEVIERLAAKG